MGSNYFFHCSLFSAESLFIFFIERPLVSQGDAQRALPAHYIATTLYCDTHQPVTNRLVSESLLQFEGIKKGPKRRIGTLYQGFEPQVPTFGYVG